MRRERDPKAKRRPAGVSTIPPERVSHTSITVSEPPDEAVTSSRSVQLREVPSVWLDRFLVAATEAPISAGEEAAASVVIDALFGILRSYAVGACFVRPAEAKGEGGAPASPRGQHQTVVRRVPPGDEARALGVDPTRLFPGYTHERVFEIGAGYGGSTLHVAADDPSLDDDRGAVVHLARRAAAVLGRTIERAREHARLEATLRELRSLEKHVIQADKLASFGQIAAGMVHELNNPLTSIVAYTDYLIRKFVAAPERSAVQEDDVDRLRRISESANRMLRFTRDLVSYARPSSEVAVPVVLHTVIDQAVAFCEHLITEAGAKIDRRYDPEVLTVRARPEQLAQVFVNLITNACHAMPASKGLLVLATELADAGRTVVVRVEDNGHGIAKEHLSQVFAPFFTTKADGRGTGLGLSIVKSIVDHHDGEIRVESEQARGTCFVLRLPTGGR